MPCAISCGEWTKPTTHFQGVNEYGAVSYWDQIGELVAMDGAKLPLIIGFRSDWEPMEKSPYLGNGWFFGIFDSRFIQRSEGSFDMISLDGYTVPFGRDTKHPEILNGAQGWKAEIKGDSINAWASCGWKLSFIKGKLSTITTPKNRSLDIRRDQDGVAIEIVDGTTVLAKVDRHSNGLVSGIKIGNRLLRIDLVDKPIIQVLNGISLVSSKQLAVGRIQLQDELLFSFDYSPTESLVPSLAIFKVGADKRVITWDASTKMIRSDNDWVYDIQIPSESGHNAAIQRSNKNGEKEFWHYNMLKGEEVKISAAGERQTTSWFLSGVLAGKLRSQIISTEKGDTLSKLTRSYDENGRALRQLIETSKGDSSEEHYFLDGGMKRVDRSATQVITKLYKKGGDIVFQRSQPISQKQ